MVARTGRPALLRQVDALILLDTNALLWWHRGHRRAAVLKRLRGVAYMSPASMLELQFLLEAGKLRLLARGNLASLLDDERWLLDDPPSAAWFERARAETWTRDPFDRLIVAHAALRGWKLATGDAALLARLGAGATVEL